ncbi:NitT/TauT family transport system permease protein [Arthrobacter pigmenti]|uniref:NitT/TauT family transport system permease protein n=1 Tax=Arthrobacter pigmenti TaxID=271432 RepID=A0A846RW99_9MICC|nr:ABC transporter permease [Arthrobacter pigmenti]NJC23306.1 NitT/TauT family transport system permease protein [Arthrobacter pigmenti]
MQPEPALIQREDGIEDVPVKPASLTAEDDRALEKGLDALQQETSVRSSWKASITKALLPVAALAAVIYAWQMYIWIARPRPDQLPGPADVFGTLGTLWQNGEAVETVLTSLQRGVVGFVIAVVIATPLGLLLAQSRILRGAFGPLISGLQVLPSVAWVPAAVIWFGLSDATVYFVVLMGAIPSITNGLIAGVDHVPDQHRRVGHVLGASRWELATRIILPAALPSYVSGLKQGWAFSWRSLMAAEIIATGGTLGFGLGALLDQGRQFSSMATVIAAILLILFIGIVVELLIFGPLERRLLRRRGLLIGGSQ